MYTSALMAAVVISIHTVPKDSDEITKNIFDPAEFQSTPSRRTVTENQVMINHVQHISIHTVPKDSDLEANAVLYKFKNISIHTVPKDSDAMGACTVAAGFLFQSTPSRRTVTF